MRCFVTGATGFVGGRLVRQLKAAGHDVIAVARDPAKAADLAATGVAVQRGDVIDKESMRGPMTGADAVFHVAGWYKIGVRDRTSARAINVEGTRHVLELMQELGVPKGVYTSTLAVNSDTRGQLVDETYQFRGRHLTVYDQTKADAHAMAQRFIGRGLPLVIVQPGVVYGPGDTSGLRTTWRQFLRRQIPAVPRRTAYAWAHVDDVARGHLLALEKGQAGRNYFICGPVHTLEEAFEIASDVTGIPAPRLRVPLGVLRIAAGLMAPVERLLSASSTYSAEALRALSVTYIGSNARARRELGWEPRPLREGLTETLRHEMALMGMAPAPGQ